MPGPEIMTQIIAWLQGDTAAFEAVFHYYRPRLLNYTRKFLKSESHAEDMTTEVLVKIWEKRSAINDPTTFENYLFTIARNNLIKEWQKTINTMLSLEVVGELANETDTTDSIYLSKELERCYLETLQELPPQRRKIFLLHREEKLSYREIAAQLNISPKTVENHIAAALKQLRTRLTSYLQMIL